MIEIPVQKISRAQNQGKRKGSKSDYDSGYQLPSDKQNCGTQNVPLLLRNKIGILNTCHSFLKYISFQLKKASSCLSEQEVLVTVYWSYSKSPIVKRDGIAFNDSRKPSESSGPNKSF